MTKSTEEQIAAIERRMEQLRARKQRIVARENARARRRRTHLLIQLGGILASDSVLGYDERVWGDEGNRRRLLAALGAHAVGLRNVLLRDLIRTDRVESMEYLQRIARTRRQLIADVEGSEPETAGILLAHIDELGQALNQHYRPAQSRFSGDSDQ